MTSCRGCNAPLPPSAGPRPRVWCSDRCRKAGARTSPTVKPCAGPGPNRQAVERDIARLDGVDDAVIEAARSLADMVDRQPGSAALWARYLQALELLRADVDDDADEVAALIAQLSGGEP
jgi:hypothetical protein